MNAFNVNDKHLGKYLSRISQWNAQPTYGNHLYNYVSHLRSTRLF